MLYLKAILSLLAVALMCVAGTTILKMYWLGVSVYWFVNAILELVNNY